VLLRFVVVLVNMPLQDKLNGLENFITRLLAMLAIQGRVHTNARISVSMLAWRRWTTDIVAELTDEYSHLLRIDDNPVTPVNGHVGDGSDGGDGGDGGGGDVTVVANTNTDDGGGGGGVRFPQDPKCGGGGCAASSKSSNANRKGTGKGKGKGKGNKTPVPNVVTLPFSGRGKLPKPPPSSGVKRTCIKTGIGKTAKW
jgi:hypothetical protein